MGEAGAATSMPTAPLAGAVSRRSERLTHAVDDLAEGELGRVIARHLVARLGRERGPDEHRPGQPPRLGLVALHDAAAPFSYSSRARGTVAASARDSSSASPAAARMALEAPTPAVGRKPTAASPQSAIRRSTHRPQRISDMAHGCASARSSMAAPTTGTWPISLR